MLQERLEVHLPLINIEDDLIRSFYESYWILDKMSAIGYILETKKESLFKNKELLECYIYNYLRNDRETLIDIFFEELEETRDNILLAKTMDKEFKDTFLLGMKSKLTKLYYFLVVIKKIKNTFLLEDQLDFVNAILKEQCNEKSVLKI